MTYKQMSGTQRFFYVDVWIKLIVIGFAGLAFRFKYPQLTETELFLKVWPLLIPAFIFALALYRIHKAEVCDATKMPEERDGG